MKHLTNLQSSLPLNIIETNSLPILKNNIYRLVSMMKHLQVQQQDGKILNLTVYRPNTW